MVDDVTGHRIDALEIAVQRLQDEAVSQRWLDERFGRLHDKFDTVVEDIGEMKQAERSRRLSVYTAVIVAVVSLVSALVMVALTTPGAPV